MDPEKIRDELLPSEKIRTDIDGDGVPILEDCDPLDEQNQDFTGAIKSAASRVKSGLGTVKQKIQDYRERRKAKKRGEEVKESVERKKKLEELKQKRRELEEKKKVKQKEKQIKDLEKKVGDDGLLSKFMSIFEPAQKKASGKRKSGDLDKWAVVDKETGDLVETYGTKSSAKSAADYLGGEYDVYRTEVVQRHGQRSRKSRGRPGDVITGGGGSGQEKSVDFSGLVGSGRKKKTDGRDVKDLGEDLL